MNKDADSFRCVAKENFRVIGPTYIKYLMYYFGSWNSNCPLFYLFIYYDLFNEPSISKDYISYNGSKINQPREDNRGATWKKK
jgi:hypothetical protein